MGRAGRGKMPRYRWKIGQVGMWKKKTNEKEISKKSRNLEEIMRVIILILIINNLVAPMLKAMWGRPSDPGCQLL